MSDCSCRTDVRLGVDKIDARRDLMKPRELGKEETRMTNDNTTGVTTAYTRALFEEWMELQMFDYVRMENSHGVVACSV